MAQLKIFISHSHEDNAFCQKLVGALKNASSDVNVWYDDESLGSGHLLDTIERELRNRPVFILIVSPSALQSQWVRNEASWAFNCYQRDPQRIILPVVAQSVDPNDIWLFIEPFKRIEAQIGGAYPADEALKKTLEALYLGKDTATSALNENVSSDELFQRGILFSIRGKYQDAYESLTRSLTLDPDNLEISLELGRVLGELGRIDEMQQFYHECLQIQPRSASEWSIRARMQSDLGQLPDALESVEQASRLDGNSTRTWNIKGVVLFRLQRYDEALAALDRYLLLDPNYPIVWGNRAITLIYLQQYYSALTAAEISLQLDSENIPARLNKGWALLGLQRFKEALENSQDINSTGLADAESWLCGGLALLCMGRREEGEFWLNKARQLPSYNVDVPFEFRDGALVAHSRIATQP